MAAQRCIIPRLARLPTPRRPGEPGGSAKALHSVTKFSTRLATKLRAKHAASCQCSSGRPSRIPYPVSFRPASLPILPPHPASRIIPLSLRLTPRRVRRKHPCIN